MKPLWRTTIILTAIAGATISAISIFQRTKQPSIALTEEWIATQVADGDSITVRQTDGSQMSVELCGIDAPELKQGKTPGQPLAKEAKQKLLKLIATAHNQLMIVPVAIFKNIQDEETFVIHIRHYLLMKRGVTLDVRK
ncbi:thermonuclease family protein [Nostoc sp. PA-18-2419]|uniref:thermonuclease family protein n=1 Tax=Nostoc sp. PA-18-2419 TaxID=2575443 RepID=UPI001675D102|nr:thermonuclease family protein [Nostoc sp. PA-18-2419]